jgi:16S rRNA (cytosine967-C5)-methyltransferase
VQENLLRAAVEMLRPGGILVYCTCSLERQEGPRRVASLLEGNPHVERKPLEVGEISVPSEWVTTEGDLRTLPCHFGEYDGVDGFYAARLVKRG